MFDNIREDWRTYERQLTRQGLWVMVVYRFGNWRYKIRSRAIRLPFSILYKFLKVVSEILTGIELPCEVKLGRRFRIDHFGGIVISGDAVFGDDCVIRNGVTVGLRHMPAAARRSGNRQSSRHWRRRQGAGQHSCRGRCCDWGQRGGDYRRPGQLHCRRCSGQDSTAEAN